MVDVEAVETINPEKKRIFYYDNLKFILIFLVVLGHFAEVIYFKYPFLTGLRYFIYTFHMPLFVFVSGIFSNSRRYSLKKTLIRSAEFLMWYLLLKLTTWFLRVVILQDANFKLNLLAESGIPWYVLVMALWTVTLPIVRKIHPAVLLPISIIFAVGAGYIPQIGNFLALSRFFAFAPFFYFGYFCNREKCAAFGRIKPYFKVTAAVLLACLFAAALMFSDYIKPTAGLMSGRNSYAACGLGAAGGIYRLIYMAAAVAVSALLMAAVPGKKRWYTVFGERTLQVYVIHAVIFSFLFAAPWLLYNFVGNSFAKQLLLIPIALITTVALANGEIKAAFDRASNGFSALLSRVFSRPKRAAGAENPPEKQ